MGRSSAGLYNIISIFFFLLSLIWVVYVIVQLMQPAPVQEEAVLALPTALVLPTFTPSNTPPPTSTPTDTLTPAPTLSPTATSTETLVPTSSPTITDTPGPTATPTTTPTPEASFTPVPTATPTGPTETFTPSPTSPSPFPFDLRENNVIFTQNFANTAGCAWQGIGGQVFDLAGNPLPGLQVHVFGADIDRFVPSGANTLYGPAGWEMQVGTTISGSTYLVELQTAQGTIISPSVQVTFPNNCAQNLALVNFIQTRPL